MYAVCKGWKSINPMNTSPHITTRASEHQQKDSPIEHLVRTAHKFDGTFTTLGAGIKNNCILELSI